MLCDVPDRYVEVIEDRIALFLPESVIVSGAEWLLRKRPLNERWRFNKYAVRFPIVLSIIFCFSVSLHIFWSLLRS